MKPSNQWAVLLLNKGSESFFAASPIKKTDFSGVHIV